VLIETSLPFEADIKLIRRIRRHPAGRHVPLLILSGFSQPAFRNLSLALGADDYLVKPLDFDLLEKYLKDGFAGTFNAGKGENS
jgi:DNA-binding response OmpR family regulator